MFKRNIDLVKQAGGESFFLFGPRQTGKSTLIKESFPNALYYDLLQSDQFMRLTKNPELLREELLGRADRPLVVIDEVQKIPILLDEIQWLIVNRGIQFVLCGSSARKLKKTSANMLGGRALMFHLFPLVSAEIEDFDLLRAVNHGLIPRHYLHKHPDKLLQAYLNVYLKEEILDEALTRNLPAFGNFLSASAFSNGDVPVYSNIAQECGVSASTIKGYFEILADTLIIRECPAYRKKPKRRVIQSPRIYYFDVGIVNNLLKRGQIEYGSDNFGKAFEHLIFHELSAYSAYTGKDFPVSYWRTTSQLEVDFILGDHEIAIEVKGTAEVKPKHTVGLRALADEYQCRQSIIVSNDRNPRRLDDILVLPWREFLGRLWAGEII